MIRENQNIKVYKATYKGKCSQNTFVGNRRLVRARLVLNILVYKLNINYLVNKKNEVSQLNNF